MQSAGRAGLSLYIAFGCFGDAIQQNRRSINFTLSPGRQGMSVGGGRGGILVKHRGGGD
jgi:hypothetical protein